MRSVKSLLAAGAATLISSMAFAADMPMARGAAGGGRSGGVDLTPEDIDVRAVVFARFTTA